VPAGKFPAPSGTTLGFPPNDLPDGARPLRQIQAGFAESGRFFFRATNNHQVFVRIGRFNASVPHKALITVRGDCVMPPDFTPLFELSAPTSPIPTPWNSCGLKTSDHCYYVDGLTWDPSAFNFTLDSQAYYQIWETTRGYYFYIGFFDKGLRHPIYPPGEFVIEAAATYYYGEGKHNFGEGAHPPMELPLPSPQGQKHH
jgi:hypothetical protein